MTDHVDIAVFEQVKSSPDGCSPKQLKHMLRDQYDSREVQNAVVRLVSRGDVEVGPDWLMRARSEIRILRDSDTVGGRDTR